MHILKSLDTLDSDISFDVAVIGSGAAGLATALFAALEGRRVLLVEHTEYVGGTSAFSAGTTWIPGSQHASSVNPQDSLAEAARYLDNAVGEHSSRELRQAFLDHGAETVATLEGRSELKFRPYPKHPDYISDLGGSTLCGRALEPLPFDGRLLGPLFRLIRPPIPEFTVLGGMMVDRTDINHLLGMTKSLRSLRHSVRIVLRHLRDRLSHSRGTRLVMGNALVGRLLYSLSKHAQVTLALGTSLTAIERAPANGPVQAIELEASGVRRRVRLSGGLVLAGGGFNRDPQRRAAMLPGIHSAWCPGAPGHTGKTVSLALGQGASLGSGARSHAFWAPVSLRQRTDGSSAVFPHFVMDRAKPGFITVNQTGLRFLNESTSYHLFGLAMQTEHPQPSTIPAYLICDADALRKYGIGMVRPGGKGLAPFLADGYLTMGRTLDELAQRLGIPPRHLRASVERFNTLAESGVDKDFQRGVTAYQQNLGDPAWTGANPCMGPLRQGPFYAVRLYPGDIGAATGLATDADARVLDASGQAIDGLYAVGNDMQSIMGGVYPAPGITLGPAMVFGFLASRHASARA